MTSGAHTGQRRRRPALTPAEKNTVGWMFVLGVCFGLCLVAGHEAYLAGLPVWTLIFDCFAVQSVILYFSLTAELVKFWEGTGRP